MHTGFIPVHRKSAADVERATALTVPTFDAFLSRTVPPGEAG